MLTILLYFQIFTTQLFSSPGNHFYINSANPVIQPDSLIGLNPAEFKDSILQFINTMEKSENDTIFYCYWQHTKSEAFILNSNSVCPKLYYISKWAFENPELIILEKEINYLHERDIFRNAMQSMHDSLSVNLIYTHNFELHFGYATGSKSEERAFDTNQLTGNFNHPLNKLMQNLFEISLIEKE